MVREIARVPRGRAPQFGGDGNWLAASVAAPFRPEWAEKPKEPAPPEVVAVELASGKVRRFEAAEGFSFSDRGDWLALKLAPTGDEKKSESAKAGRRTLVLHRLSDGFEDRLTGVSEHSFEPEGGVRLAAACHSEDKWALVLYDLSSPEPAVLRRFLCGEKEVAQISFSETEASTEQSLAFLRVHELTHSHPAEAELWIWSEGDHAPSRWLRSEDAPKGRVIPKKNLLRFSEDRERLFFGFQPREMHALVLEELEEKAAERAKKKAAKDEGDEEEEDDSGSIYDLGKIAGERGLDLWHEDDPMIKPQEKKTFSRRRDKSYSAVLHLQSRALVSLADEDLPDVYVNENPNFALGRSSVPYLKSMTWRGFNSDLWLVDIRSGERQLIAEKQNGGAALSPEGRWLAFFEDKAWHLLETATGKRVDLTTSLRIPFENELHDYPSTPPSYALAGLGRGRRSGLDLRPLRYLAVPHRGWRSLPHHRRTGPSGEDHLPPDPPRGPAGRPRTRGGSAALAHIRSDQGSRIRPRPRRPARPASYGRRAASPRAGGDEPSRRIGPREAETALHEGELRGLPRPLGQQSFLRADAALERGQPPDEGLRLGQGGARALDQPRRHTTHGCIDQTRELRRREALPRPRLLLPLHVGSAPSLQSAGDQPPPLLPALGQQRLCDLSSGHPLRGRSPRLCGHEVPCSGRAEADRYGRRRSRCNRAARALLGGAIRPPS